jgi:hypothetical protein
VAKAHEGIGHRVGCNTPAGWYGPSQDEKPWGRGLRALLDDDCGILGCHTTSREQLTGLRIVRCFPEPDLDRLAVPVVGSGGDDNELDHLTKLGVRAHRWLASAGLALYEIMLDQGG